MKVKILLILLVILLSNCTRLADANLQITNKVTGRDEKNQYYEIVEITNKGEQPAYFVILIGKAYLGGKLIQNVERSYGDIFPAQKREYKLVYNLLGLNQPDSIIYNITYSQSSNYPLK